MTSLISSPGSGSTSHPGGLSTRDDGLVLVDDVQAGARRHDVARGGAGRARAILPVPDLVARRRGGRRRPRSPGLPRSGTPCRARSPRARAPASRSPAAGRARHRAACRHPPGGTIQAFMRGHAPRITGHRQCRTRSCRTRSAIHSVGAIAATSWIPAAATGGGAASGPETLRKTAPIETHELAGYLDYMMFHEGRRAPSCLIVRLVLAQNGASFGSSRAGLLTLDRVEEDP